MEYTLEFFEDFTDGNVYPRQIRRGEIIQIDELTYLKIKQSAPTACIVRSKHIPPPTIKCLDCGVIYLRAEEHVCEAKN